MHIYKINKKSAYLNRAVCQAFNFLRQRGGKVVKKEFI